MDWVLFGMFLALMLAGVPLGIALGLAGTAVIATANLGIMSVPTNVYTGIAKYPLLAIPMFVLAGLVFERAGVARSMVQFAASMVGRKHGGLAITAVLVGMVLGGISGSGPADAAAVGTIMIPAMVKDGYPRAFAASLIAAGGSTAILIPPSIALIIYSLLVPQATVHALFAGGLVPGILAGVTLIVIAVWLCKRHGFGLASGEARPPFWRSLRAALWGLAAPVIILGGMRSGLFTPTEAAVVAAFYGFAVGVLVYRSLSLEDIYEVLVEAAEISAVILLIVALASVFAYASSTLGTFDRMARFLVGSGSSETMILLGITVLLLIAGMFLDAISIYFIFLPLLVPIAVHYQWDLVWFGIIITMNLAIGQFTPPMAVNLLVTSRIADVPIESTVPWVAWFVAAMLTGLLAITFIPEIALYLPRALGYL
ncbi:MAG: TRAP transporter large permease [Burkholderiales bacterium]|nr:TRAP transporter large permease [Burkholderiales bacterium]